MKRFLLLVVTCALAVVRFHITPRLNLPTSEGSYEACAHLFVGGLIGAWLIARNGGVSTYAIVQRRQTAYICGVLALLLTVVELVCFLIQKG